MSSKNEIDWDQAEAEANAAAEAAEQKAEAVMEVVLCAVLDEAMDDEIIWEHARDAYDASGFRLGLAKLPPARRLTYAGRRHASYHRFSRV
jgi:hypothetical protein